MSPWLYVLAAVILILATLPAFSVVPLTDNLIRLLVLLTVLLAVETAKEMEEW